MDSTQFTSGGSTNDYDFNLFALRSALEPYAAWALDWWRLHGDEPGPRAGVERVADAPQGVFIRTTGKKFTTVPKGVDGLTVYPLVSVPELGIAGVSGGLSKFIETVPQEDLRVGGVAFEARWNVPQVLNRSHWFAMVPEKLYNELSDRSGYALGLRLSELQQMAAGDMPDSVAIKAATLYGRITRKLAKAER